MRFITRTYITTKMLKNRIICGIILHDKEKKWKKKKQI